MKWSYEWLKEYLDTDLTPQQIADKLTSIGLEVESVEYRFYRLQRKLLNVFHMKTAIICMC